MNFTLFATQNLNCVYLISTIKFDWQNHFQANSFYLKIGIIKQCAKFQVFYLMNWISDSMNYLNFFAQQT